MKRPTDTKPQSIDWDWLRGEIRAASAGFADQLRLVPDGSVKVPNLDWDVRGLAAHLVTLPDFYQELNDRDEPFVAPDDWAAFSRQARAHLDDVDTATLADRLEPEVESLLAALGDDGDRPWKLYLETTAAKVGAGLLSELLLHGRDLAPLTGAEVEITERQCHAIIAAMMTLAPFFVDREAGRRCPGVYHLKFRGGNDYTYRMDDGLLTVEEGRPDRPDCHMVADPVAFVLVAMGRMSQARAGLTGKMMAYGRKPWKLVPLGKVMAEGV
ncbi:MAG: maleylpyruvate isomerase N-terminal domain-containing protein [Acidimicrobiales bacterium]